MKNRLVPIGIVCLLIIGGFVGSIGLFIEKLVCTDFNLGQQPKLMEFVIPPNSTVKIMGTQSANNGAISCILTGYRV